MAVLKHMFVLTFLHNVGAAMKCNNEEYENNFGFYLKPLSRNISQSCSMQLQIYTKGVRDMEHWALKMFTSTSRIPTGTFSSRYTDLGDFDQCIGIAEQVENQLISGKYCLAKFTHRNDLLLLREKNITLYNILAICLPSACSDEEVSTIWFQQAREYLITEVACQVKKNAPPGFGFNATITVLVILILLMVFSTIYDVIIKTKRTDAKHKVLVGFSMINNGKSMLASRQYSGKIGCLDGIRTLALAWIMLGHRWDSYYTLPLRNLKHFFNRYYYPSTTLVARAYGLNVNSFFVMGGALVTYSFLRSKEQCDKFNVISYYVNRYVRLTPALAAMVLIQITTFKLLGSGPLWPMTTGYMEDDCRGYWWSALLYIQNYANPLYMCIVPAWYLSVDMQLYLLAPSILIPLCKFPKKTLTCLAILIIGVAILTAVMYWNKSLTPVFHMYEQITISVFELIPLNGISVLRKYYYFHLKKS